MENIKNIIRDFRANGSKPHIEDNDKANKRSTVLKTGIEGLDDTSLFVQGRLTGIHDATNWGNVIYSNIPDKNTFLIYSLCMKANKKCLIVEPRERKNDLARDLINMEMENSKKPFYEDHDEMNYNDKINLISSAKLYYSFTDNFEEVFEILNNSNDFSAVMIKDFDSYKLYKHSPDLEQLQYVLNKLEKMAEEKNISLTVCTNNCLGTTHSTVNRLSDIYMEWHEIYIKDIEYVCALLVDAKRIVFFNTDTKMKEVKNPYNR